MKTVTALKALSCNALDAIVQAHAHGKTAPTKEEITQAREILDTRECEGNCPCLSCEEE